MWQSVIGLGDDPGPHDRIGTRLNDKGARKDAPVALHSFTCQTRSGAAPLGRSGVTLPLELLIVDYGRTGQITRRTAARKADHWDRD